MKEYEYADEHELQREREKYVDLHFPKKRLRSGGEWWETSCLLHTDNKPSLGIKLENCYCYCQSCEQGWFLDKYAEAAAGLLPPAPRPPSKESREEAKAENQKTKAKSSGKHKYSPTVAEYIYTDGSGRNHMKVVRTEAKDFFQQRWDGLKWQKGLTGPEGQIDRLPYNLRRILETQAQGETLLWVEGEKDADKLNSLGFTATTSPGGAKSAGKLTAWKMFEGRRVCIIPDNDAAGEKYSRIVAASLVKAKALEVKICELPNLPPKGDVSDWMKGRTVDDLKAVLLEHSEDFIQPTKPDVQIDWRDVRDVADETISYLTGHDLFNRGGELVHLVRRQGLEPPGLKALDRKELLAYLCRHMSFFTKLKGEKTKACAPPEWLAGLILDSLNTFPQIRRVTELPFVNAVGDLVTKEGLDPTTGTFLIPLYPDLQIPTNPTAEQAQESARWLATDFLGGFPFAEEFHRTHAVTALIQPFVFSFMATWAPLVSVSATTMGTGKTRLCRTIGYVSSMTGPEMLTESQNPQHFETAAMSVLRDAPTSVLIDNVKSNLDHVWLQGLLSGPEINHRLMATNTVIKVRNPQLWLVSANNPNWNPETRRRILPIELDSKMECPWHRRPEEFKIPDIERFAQAERRTILQHIFTILQYWRSQGRPLSSDFLGSYERWAKVMGGIMALTGLPGFLQHVKNADADMDQEVLEWRALLELWHGRRTNSDDWRYPGEVLGYVKELGILSDLLDSKTDGAMATAMGRALTRMRGRVFGDYRLIRRQGRKGWEYFVERVDRGDQAGPEGGGEPPRGGGGGGSGPPADHGPDLPTMVGAVVGTSNGSTTGLAAECRPCRPQTPPYARAGNSLSPDGPGNVVGNVGKVGTGGEDVGWIAAEVTKLQRQIIFLGLRQRRLQYRSRDSGSEFIGSKNPRWHKDAKDLIEAGLWIPPNDLPWDGTLKAGPPPGWVFAGDQAASSSAEPARASPPADERTLSECLDQILL